nr:probable GMP synthase [glutamine-hydrolyzing] [Ipomoea batatas]
MNHADPELRPVLGPAGNKARSVELRKPVEKLKAAANKAEKPAGGVEKKFQAMPMESRSPEKKCGSVGSILRQQQEHRSFLMRSNLWMNASCSSDASSDSFQSRASTGRVSRRSVTPSSARRKQCSSKVEKIDKVASEAESLSVSSEDASVVKKRCSWVTSNTDPLYSTFHDEEWGVPVHDDRMLFELLSLCTALAELTWPAILSRRQTFREVFQNFDPVAVSKLNEKKIMAQGSPASSLLSELKLRAVIDNARQICKIIDELGSFNKYIWDFVNKKPVVNNFRYPRQVPIKTSKAEMISKDLVRRGFRGVGPTVVYSFMQVAGITNDHLVSCFRFHHCIAAADASNTGNSLRVVEAHVKHLEDETELGLVRAIDDLNLSS